MGFLNRNINRVYYLAFLLLLYLTFCVIRIIGLVHPLIPRKRIKSDLILFPYAFIGSDGYTRRFLEYFPFMEKDGLRYKVCNLFTDTYMQNATSGSNLRRYCFYLQTIWKRIPQVISSKDYKAAFIQRGLFPLYYDLKVPYLEILLTKFNKNITIDYWDSVSPTQQKLVAKTLEYVNRVTLSNEYLVEHFSAFPSPKFLYKVAINTRHYLAKTSYKIEGAAKLIWTGLPHNLPSLRRFIPVFEEINREIPIKLILICKEKVDCGEIPVEYHLWEQETFFKLLSQADIGIYPETDSIRSRGKSAMKVMDYLSAALPILGVPYGIPSEAIHGKELLIAETEDEWRVNLFMLLRDQNLRETLGKNGRTMVDNLYSLDKSYDRFKEIVLGTSIL